MYENIEKRRASWRRYYYRNKERFVARQLAKKKALRALIAHIKRAPCSDCKRYYPAAAMDFDHVRGEKVARISKLVDNGMGSALLKELEKCELVCANCHRIRTHNRLQL